MNAPLTKSSRYLYCIPPHTHALLRFRVHSVTPSRVAYYAESGVTVDKTTGEALDHPEGPEEAGPIRIVPMDRVDMSRSWEGAPPEEAVYYSTIDSFRRLHVMTLVQYGLHEMDEYELWDEELAVLRRRMIRSHPDHGGSEEAFSKARAAYEAARRQRAGDS